VSQYTFTVTDAPHGAKTATSRAQTLHNGGRTFHGVAVRREIRAERQGCLVEKLVAYDVLSFGAEHHLVIIPFAIGKVPSHWGLIPFYAAIIETGTNCCRYRGGWQ
jgi:hypothetical protein